MKWSLVQLSLLLLAFFSCIPGFSQPPLGSKAPEIALRDRKGEIISLSSLEGKVVLLDFWASWCGPCRRNNKHLKPLYDKYKDKGFEIYSVSIDANDKAWQGAVRQDETNWVHVIDPTAAHGNELLQTWNVRFIPSTFLLDKTGKIVAGGLEAEDLEKWLKKLL